MNEQFVSEHIMNIHENYFVTLNNASFGSSTSIGWSLILVRIYSNWYTIILVFKETLNTAWNRATAFS